MISMDAVVVQESEPVTAIVDGEVVMLSVSAGAYISLNGVGSDIWNRLREPCKLGDLCQELSKVYNADIATLSRDVGSFVQALVERGLLRLVATEKAP
jgi:hypothetical protein